MKGRVVPRILAVPLFVALVISPAIVQEGLRSFWVSWGQPLLVSAAVFAVLTGIVLGPANLIGKYVRRRAHAIENSEKADLLEKLEELADGERTAGAGDVATVKIALADALSELEPENFINFMDLARALQEMGRDADTLEVLAHVLEGKDIQHGEEVAEVLRRLRRKLSRENPASA